MSQNNRVALVDPAVLPSVSEAYQHYTSLGGTLTEPHNFGVDPLQGNGHLQQVRHDLFKEKFSKFDPLFSSIVNGDCSPLKEGLIFYMEVTKRLSVSSCV